MRRLSPPDRAPLFPQLAGQVLPVPLAAVQRAPTSLPLTPMQYTVTMLTGLGMNMTQISLELDVERSTIASHVRNAADRIPGDLPARTKLMAWARGATRDVLEGHSLRFEIEIVAQRPRLVTDGTPI